MNRSNCSISHQWVLLRALLKFGSAVHSHYNDFAIMTAIAKIPITSMLTFAPYVPRSTWTMVNRRLVITGLASIAPEASLAPLPPPPVRACRRSDGATRGSTVPIGSLIPVAARPAPSLLCQGQKLLPTMYSYQSEERMASCFATERDPCELHLAKHF